MNIFKTPLNKKCLIEQIKAFPSYIENQLVRLAHACIPQLANVATTRTDCERTVPRQCCAALLEVGAVLRGLFAATLVNCKIKS